MIWNNIYFVLWKLQYDRNIWLIEQKCLLFVNGVSLESRSVKTKTKVARKMLTLTTTISRAKHVTWKTITQMVLNMVRFAGKIVCVYLLFHVKDTDSTLNSSGLRPLVQFVFQIVPMLAWFYFQCLRCFIYKPLFAVSFIRVSDEVSFLKRWKVNKSESLVIPVIPCLSLSNKHSGGVRWMSNMVMFWYCVPWCDSLFVFLMK